MVDIIIGVLVVVAVFFIGKKALKDMKQGKCAGCSCSAKKKADKPVNIKF